MRDPDRPSPLPNDGKRVAGDLNDLSSLKVAFKGAQKLFLLTQGVGIDFARNALAAAESVGVRHIVFVSSYSVTLSPRPAMAHWHYEREELITASGIAATFLRPGGFMTNTLDWLPTIRQGGYVFDPIGPGRFAPIDPADIAAVAAVVLTHEGHDGKKYVLTGEESLTVQEQVQTISELAGCAIQTRAPSNPEEVVRSRFPNGAPKALADALMETVGLMRSDTVGLCTETVQQLLGRGPRSFRHWGVSNAHLFRDAFTDFQAKNG